jgi:hypothetical protein
VLSQTMPVADALDGGREFFGRHAWGDAFAELSAADRENALVVAAHDLDAARAAAAELAQFGDELRQPLLHAVSGYATGAILLGESDARAALVVLRRAWAAWRDLDAPYEAARV